MSESNRDDIFLSNYRATSKQLQSGQKIPDIQMLEFHGTTGLLLADIYGQLWSKTELQGEINETIRKKCEACRSGREDGKPIVLRAIETLTPWRWPFAVAVFSPFAAEIATRVISSLAK